MGLVYQYAEVVISADAAKDSSGGLFFVREQPVKLAAPSTRRSGVPLTLYARTAVEHAYHTSAQIENSMRDPLWERAWVLQEWLLARRVIHFASQEIVWDCRHTVSCECGGFNMLVANDPPQVRQEHLQDRRALRGSIARALGYEGQPITSDLELSGIWADVVEEYTSRFLTKSQDRMIAIAGLAEQIAAAHGPEMGIYASGLFGQDAHNNRVLALQLLWSRLGDSKPHERPQDRTSPTWSWGAIDEAVEWISLSAPGFTAPHIRSLASIEFEPCSILSKNKRLGTHSVDRLHLSTKVLGGTIRSRAIFDWGHCYMQLTIPLARAVDKSNTIEEVMFQVDVNIGSLLKTGNLKVRCAKILEYEQDKQLHSGCLVLRDTNRSERSVRIWERIGVCIREVPAGWFAEATVEDLFIE